MGRYAAFGFMIFNDIITPPNRHKPRPCVNTYLRLVPRMFTKRRWLNSALTTYLWMNFITFFCHRNNLVLGRSYSQKLFGDLDVYYIFLSIDVREKGNFSALWLWVANLRTINVVTTQTFGFRKIILYCTYSASVRKRLYTMTIAIMFTIFAEALFVRQVY